MSKKYKENILIILYISLLSFIILLFTSKCSFMYPFNDWVDANAFFTVGKGIFKGIVPYKDVFEQKGPFLYLIYGIGSLISYKTFYGVFILEVLFWIIGLYYLYKICKMFVNSKLSIIVITLFITLISTTYSFTHGGSCEEFMLPFFMISLYYLIKYFKTNKLTTLEIFINGIVCGLVFLSKYTLLGFWIGFACILIIDYIKNKQYKNILINGLIFILGIIITTIPFIIYFMINNGLKDFINCYFLTNINSYGEKINIFKKPFIRFCGILISFIKNPIIFIIMLISIFSFIKLNIDKKYKYYLLIVFIISLFFVFYGLKFYRYYLLFILYFLSISLINIIYIIKDKLNNKYILPIVIILSLIYSYSFPNYKDFRNTRKEDLFQVKFANIINEYNGSTLLNMGKLDAGVYTTSGIVPNTYFFEKQNIDYKYFPENIDKMHEYIKNKEVEFVVYYTHKKEDKLKNKEKDLYNNYELIASEEQYFEGKLFHAYLFKVKK